MVSSFVFFFFFFNDTATTEIYTLSLHDALPICTDSACPVAPVLTTVYFAVVALPPEYPETTRETPLTCLKTASTPQKQPPASTAVCSPAAAGKPDSAAKPGIWACAALAASTLLAHTRASFLFKNILPPSQRIGADWSIRTARPAPRCGRSSPPWGRRLPARCPRGRLA